MDTDNAFETLIELLSTPIMILLDEQENGGKVSNLLDNNEKESVHATQEVTNGSFLTIFRMRGRKLRRFAS